MLTLTKLLLEEYQNPKAIILGGAAGSGKTYIVNNLLGDLKGNIFTPEGSDIQFKYMNPDKYVEKQNLSLGKAMSKFKEDFTQTQQQKENIIWDTTAANIKNTLNKLEGYDKFMIMVYTHPIISILQNAKRDRTLPLEAVIKTWNQVYSNIKEYKNQLKNNFVLFPNQIPGYEKEIKQFNQAVKGGKEKLKEYLNNLISSSPEEFKSSFSKEFSFSEDKIEQAFNETLPLTSYDKEKDGNLLKKIKKEFEKEFLKNSKNPGEKRLEAKLKSARNTRNKNEKNYNENIEGVVDKLTSSEFKEVINPIPPNELKSKLKAFLN